MAELFASDPQPPKFIIPNLLPVGLTMLSGRPKVRKSWLSLQFAHAVATGHSFYGQQIEKGRVLIIPLEDSPSRVNQRARLIGWDSPGQCDIMFAREFRKNYGGKMDENFAETMKRAIINRGYKLVIIDTFSRAFTGDQNDATQITAALSPLQEIAIKLQMSIMIIDHHKKSAGQMFEKDVIGDQSGSAAKAGVLDCSMGLYRKHAEEIAILKITGRDINDQDLVLESLNEHSGGWRIIGDESSHTKSLAQRRIREVLRGCMTDGYVTSELCALLDMSRPTLYKHCEEMVRVGEVEQTKSGRSYKYSLSANTNDIDRQFGN